MRFTNVWIHPSGRQLVAPALYTHLLRLLLCAWHRCWEKYRNNLCRECAWLPSVAAERKLWPFPSMVVVRSALTSNKILVRHTRRAKRVFHSDGVRRATTAFDETRARNMFPKVQQFEETMIWCFALASRLPAVHLKSYCSIRLRMKYSPKERDRSLPGRFLKPSRRGSHRNLFEGSQMDLHGMWINFNERH